VQELMVYLYVHVLSEDISDSEDTVFLLRFRGFHVLIFWFFNPVSSCSLIPFDRKTMNQSSASWNFFSFRNVGIVYETTN